jgi:putative ABC transport system permease protein
MTLGSFITKNTFRNKRRSVLTVLSITFSLLLLTIMMTIWRGFYIDKGPPDSGLRLMTRHRVSLAFFLPGFYRNKIRSIPGVTHVVPMTFFGGKYKDDRPENYFVQFGTDPSEYMEVAADKIIPPQQVRAWQEDRAGCIVDAELAKKHHWKIGDRIILSGAIFPANLELTVRGIFRIDPPNNSLYFNRAYLDEAVPWSKGQVGFYFTRVDSPDAVSRVAAAMDDAFRSSPEPTRSESEQAFRLSFIATLGNVKAFILSICAAVVFAILLVSANTMGMSVRERTREVAVLRTLGFTRQRILALFLGESVSLALAGGGLGVMTAAAWLHLIGKSSLGIGIPAATKVKFATMVVAMAVAGLVGLASALIPSYRASQRNIVEGLRHIG